jgi:hypothetical protein
MSISLWKSYREDYDLVVEIDLQDNSIFLHFNEDDELKWSDDLSTDIFNRQFWIRWINYGSLDELFTETGIVLNINYKSMCSV